MDRRLKSTQGRESEESGSELFNKADGEKVQLRNEAELSVRL